MKSHALLKGLYIGPRRRTGRGGRKGLALLSAVALIFTSAGIVSAGIDWNNFFKRPTVSWNGFIKDRTQHAINVANANLCIDSSWGNLGATVLHDLESRAGEIVDGLVTSIMQGFFDKAKDWLTGTVIRNLGQSTFYTSQSILEGLREIARLDLLTSLRPGGLVLDYCFPDYNDLRRQYTEAIARGELGPGSGITQNYYSRLVEQKQLLFPPAGAELYGPQEGDPDSQKDYTRDYVNQVGMATLAMGGPGSAVPELMKQSKLPDDAKTRLSGNVQRANALAQVNTNLGISGAEALTYSLDIWRRLYQFNPDSWDTGYAEQAMKDVPKLLYLQTQIMAKTLRLQGDMAVAIAALGQVQNSAMTSQILSDYIAGGGTLPGTESKN